MFGGLEIKAKTSKDDEPETAASSGGSAFGFMNPAALAAPSETLAEPAAAISSGFSFLNGASEPAPAPIALGATSGFSFMQEMTTTATVPEPAPEPPTTSASSFSFMIPSLANETPAQDETTLQIAPEVPTADSATALPGGPSSAFSFMSSGLSTIPDPEPMMPPAAPMAPVTSAASSISSATAPAPVNFLEAPAPSGPMGAGITFGTAAAPRTVRKKKSRAQKVGMGAAAPAPAMPSTAATPATAAAAPKPAESQKSTRDSAADAARRAEEFMQKKAQEQTKTKTIERASPTMAVPNYDETPAIMPTASTDEVVAAAEAAAEEAKTMAQQQAQSMGFMGTFFKGFGASNSSLGNGSTKGRRPSPTPTTDNMISNNVDRLAKKQEDMKRAMAEREIQMQQQALGDNIEDDDDDEVIVSTSVSGYKPEPEPPTAKLEIIEKPSISQTTFQPAKPKAPTYIVREIAPAPRKRKSAKETFVEYEALFAQSVHRAMEQVENVRNQQKMLMEDRFVSLAKQSLATQQISQTEAQLQVAVDEEDYELADQLGQVIEAHKREKNEVAMFLQSISAGLEQLDSQKSLVVKSVATCFENLTVRLTELKEKESSMEQNNDSGTLKQFAAISKQLSAEQERLQRELKAIELDEERAAEERKELEVAISEQSGEFQRQQDKVKAQLTGLEAEIEELRKQLEEKQKVAADLRKEMYGLDDSISKVRVKFTRQLNRVDKKERSVRENRIEWETEQAAFQRQKEAHELQVQSHSENLLAHDELMKSLEDELRLAKEFAVFVPTKLGILEDPVEHDEKDVKAEGDMAQLQADVVKSEAAVSEAKILLKAAVSVIQNLEVEHASLIAKVPQLEEMKKAAAAKRDFKAASKASKEIKDASSRLKECEEELVGEAAARKKAAEEDLIRLEAELAEARKVAEGKEKISAQKKMAALAKKIHVLESTKKELCGDCSSSENTVRGVGALVLDTQIKALQDEGETLGRKYGGWNELIKGSDADILPETKEKESKDSQNVESAPRTPRTEGTSDWKRILKGRELIKTIQATEEAVEMAATNENFEEAAELQEKSEKFQAELEALGLTDEEMEVALGDEDIPNDEPDAAEKELDTAVAEDKGENNGETGEPVEREENNHTDEAEEDNAEDNEGNSAMTTDEAESSGENCSNENNEQEQSDSTPSPDDDVGNANTETEPPEASQEAEEMAE